MLYNIIYIILYISYIIYMSIFLAYFVCVLHVPHSRRSSLQLTVILTFTIRKIDAWEKSE